MGDVTLFSEIADDHPQKGAIEEAVESAFADVAGSWVVSITVARPSSWWIVSIESASGMHRTLFVEGPEEQNPRFLCQEMRETLRDAGVVAPRLH